MDFTTIHSRANIGQNRCLSHWPIACAFEASPNGEPLLGSVSRETQRTPIIPSRPFGLKRLRSLQASLFENLGEGLAFQKYDGGQYCQGAPARCPFTVSFLGEGSPTKIDYRKKSGTLSLISQIWRA